MATEPPHVFGFALAAGERGDTVPVARSGVTRLVDLTDPATQVAIRHLNNLWLASELQQRSAAGKLPQDVLIHQVLVLLPMGAQSRVLINEEVDIGVLAQFRYPDAVPKTPGTMLAADEFEDMSDVRLPQVPADVGFVLLIYRRGTRCLAFDFTPCYPDVPTDIPLGEIRQGILRDLANAMAEGIYGRCFAHPEAVRQAMLEDGWWPALCLLPNTYDKMASAYAVGEPNTAAEIASSYLTGDRLSMMVAHWWSVPEFQERRCLIEQALNCHLQGSYGAAVCTLVPCMEGIVVSRHKAVDNGQRSPTHRQIPERLSALASDMPSAPVFSKEFEEFQVYLKRRFYGQFRHKVTHGAKLNYCPTDSIQTIVALDSLYRRFRLPVPTDIAVKPPDATG